MLLTILLAALQSAQAAAVPPSEAEMRPLNRDVPDSPGKCPEATLRYAEEEVARGPRRLIELPPGRLELTVMREFDGCPIPAVLREGIGGNPVRAEKPEPSRR